MTRSYQEDGIDTLGVGPRAKTRTGRLLQLSAAAPFVDPNGMRFASFMGYMAYARRLHLEGVPSAESRKLHTSAVGVQAETLYNRSFSRRHADDEGELADLYLGHLLTVFDTPEARNLAMVELAKVSDSAESNSDRAVLARVRAVEICDDEVIFTPLPVWQITALQKFFKRILKERITTTA